MANVTALMAPLWGRLADRFGRKIMVERSLASFVVVMTAMAYVTEAWHVFALRAVQGFFAGYGALAITMFAGITAQGSWQTWLTYRNSTSFGDVDPEFGIDLSFFVFEYPFYRLVLGFGFLWSDLACYAVGVGLGVIVEVGGMLRPARHGRAVADDGELGAVPDPLLPAVPGAARGGGLRRRVRRAAVPLPPERRRVVRKGLDQGLCELVMLETVQPD